MKTQTAWKTIAALILALLLNGCTAADQPAMLPTAAATLMSTATLAPWWPTENVPYPLDSTGFQLAGGSDEQAHQRIIELGAGEDLAALEEMYKAELRRTGKNPDSYTFEEMVWESGGKVYWDSVVKDGQGHYLGMKLTKGSEAGQVVRAFGLTRYLLDYTANDDFYDFFTLQNPTEFPDAKQQMIWDESGWHVVGLFTESGKLLGWFNADKGGGGEWEVQTGALEGEINNLYKIMSAEEMKARDLHGYGIEVNAQVEGIDTTYYIVTADALKNVMAEFGFGPFGLTEGMETDASMPLTSAQRIGMMLRVSDYLGYLQDKGLSENDYPLDVYFKDLKDGKDRSYVVYYLKDKLIIDPTKPKELVFTYGFDFDNGFFNFKSGVNSQFGYIQTSDGGLRIISVIVPEIVDGVLRMKLDEFANDPEKQARILPIFLAGLLKENLFALSYNEIVQQGKKYNGDSYYINNHYNDIFILKDKTIATQLIFNLAMAPYDGIDLFDQPSSINALHVSKIK